MQTDIPVLDLAIIVVYLLGVLAAGILSTRRQKIDSTAYFLAGRSLRWPMVGAALFASNISTIHFVGLAAAGFNEGLVWGNFEWGASFTLILLGLVFAPFYFRSRIATLPEFLERRYSPASRTFLAFMAILSALFIHIGMSLYAGAAVFEQFFGIDVVTSIVIITVITGIYTISGGLKAVVVTETIQSVVLIIGAAAITCFALAALPEHGIRSLGELKAALKPDQLSMLHADNRMGLAWYAVLLGYTVNGIWYWCTDQTIVQRVLGARSEWDAQQGAILAGFLKILPVFIMVLPGVAAYVLFRDLIGENANQTLPVLITQLIPSGMKGLISAALLAALMSTIASALNSCGTLFAVDIFTRLRPKTSDRQQVKAGRISAVVIMVLAMVWSTQGGRYTSIFEAINAIAAHLSPADHHRLPVGRLLAPGDEAGVAGDADLRLHARRPGVRRRPAGLRRTEAHHGRLGDPVPVAGLVVVRALQHRLRTREPIDATSQPGADPGADLGKPSGRFREQRPAGVAGAAHRRGSACRRFGCSVLRVSIGELSWKGPLP